MRETGRVTADSGILPLAALAAAVVGAIGSLALMLLSHPKAPPLLKVLFTGWVLSPFAGLALAIIRSKRWRPLVRTTICVLTLVITIVSLAIYTDFYLWPPQSSPAAAFTAVPPASWILAGLATGIAALVSRHNRSGDS